MKEATTQNSLRPIDNDLLGFLSATDCPLPPEAAQGAPDPSQGYTGTVEDFRQALAHLAGLSIKEVRNRWSSDS
jgi:hypothetical protein